MAQEEYRDTSKPVEEAKDIHRHGGGGGSSSTSEKSCRRLLPGRSLSSMATIPAAEAQAQSRSLSFSKLLSFRLPSSLGLGHIDRQVGGAGAEEEQEEEVEKKLKQICRSQSVPVSLRRSNVVTARVGPAAGFRVLLLQNEDSAEDQDVLAAEEAVCRICMVALSEGAVLKLECCCKGELALAHRACAIKWFAIKGNAACDVCGQEVRNLPVTLRSTSCHQTPPAAAHQATQQQQQEAAPTSTTSTGNRRYGTPILVIVSTLAYFCFLEQLLVGDHGTAALAISLPFACVLGLFSSLTTTKMVSRRYVWIYSAAQFLFIVLFTNLFYRYVRMQAVIAIILSTFAGFSVAICANSVLLHIHRWRVRRVASPTTVTEDQQEPRGHNREDAHAPMVDIEIAQPLP